MKTIRMICSLIFVVAVLFASTFSAKAIGFEAEKAYESVFVIYSDNSLGSGFAVGENCIVTNAHVIANTRNITVKTYDGSEYKASVLGINEREDIAVLIVSDAMFPVLEIADLGTMKTGDDIYAIGAPKGMEYTLTKGGVSAKERLVGNQSYIQIDAPINQGNSGGPLLSDSGQVLGMNTLKMSDSEGIGLAIPVSRICNYLESLGVNLNENGNVAEYLLVPDQMTPSETVPGQNDNEDYDYKNKQRSNEKDNNSAFYIVAAIATLSVAGNVVLVVLLINKRKEKVKEPYDPSERTDFDIDILE